MKRVNESFWWKLLDASTTEWVGFICSFLAIVVLVWLIIRIRSWFREDEDPAGQKHEMLLQFRDLHRQGDLSEEEFRSIKSRLLGDSKHRSVKSAERAKSEASGEK